ALSLLHSFPTRRSSDLLETESPDVPRPRSIADIASKCECVLSNEPHACTTESVPLLNRSYAPLIAGCVPKKPFKSKARSFAAARSEEHTSELQSRGHLV